MALNIEDSHQQNPGRGDIGSFSFANEEDVSADNEAKGLIVAGETRALQPEPQRIGAPGDADTPSSPHRGDLEEGNHLEIEEDSRSGWKEARRKVPLFRVWPSQNTFFCGGLLLTGGSDECCAPNICVWTCILAPSTLFFFHVFPSLWHRGAYALPVAVLATFVVSTGLLLLTCCTDPGIIPRREVIIATRCAAELEALLGYDVLGTKGGSTGLEPKMPETLRKQGYRWCHTCRIIRPPRASHCPDCDNCVMRYDHHCPFVNNCVGQRNYHFFFGFITSVLVLAMLVIPSILTYFSAINAEVTMNQMTSVSSSMRMYFYGLAIGCLLIIIAALLSFVLWAYHVFLITTKKTTKEFRRSIANISEEPTLCAARGPPLFDPRALVDPEDLGREAGE